MGDKEKWEHTPFIYFDRFGLNVKLQVSKEEAKAFADNCGLFFIETSAKNGLNVEDAFRAVTQEVYNRIQTGEYKVCILWAVIVIN